MNKMFILGMREEYHERNTARVKSSFVDVVDMSLRYEALGKKKPTPVAPSGNASGKDSNKRKFNPNWKNQGKGKPGRKTQRNRFKDFICHKCQQKGYIVRFCWNSEVQLQRRQKQNGSITPMVQKTLCFNCRQPEHTAKDCPLVKNVKQPKVYTIKDEPSTSADVKGKFILDGTLLINGIYV